MKSNRVYISGPITGTNDYRERFEAAAQQLEASGCEAVNPAALVLPPSCTHDDYMAVCMALLGLCGTIYMLPGWAASQGARREAFRAEELGLDVIYAGGDKR